VYQLDTLLVTNVSRQQSNLTHIINYGQNKGKFINKDFQLLVHVDNCKASFQNPANYKVQQEMHGNFHFPSHSNKKWI
jgi:hypothetical protein